MRDFRKWVFSIILACLFPLNGTASDPKVPDLTVRISYIANEGFLIETNQKKILINDIGVRVYRMVHGPYLVEDPKTGLTIDRHRNIQNLGFLFDVGGVKVFHCGDSSPRWLEDYEHFRLDKEGIDVAIMGSGFLASTTGFGIEILRDLIKADHIILMHIHHDQNSYFIDVAKQVEDEFQSVTIFETLMDSKTFTVSH